MENDTKPSEVTMPAGLTCPEIGEEMWFESDDPNFPGLIHGRVERLWPTRIVITRKNRCGIALYTGSLTYVGAHIPPGGGAP